MPLGWHTTRAVAAMHHLLMNMHASLHSICKLVGSIAYSTIIQCNKKLGIAQSMCATGSRTLQQEAARCSVASPVLYFCY